MFLSIVYRIRGWGRKCPFGHFLYRTSQALRASSPSRGAKRGCCHFLASPIRGGGIASAMTERFCPAGEVFSQLHLCFR